MTALASLLAIYSARYFTLDPATFITIQVATYVTHMGPLLLHVGGAVVALGLGPWQFSSRLRARRPALHRLIGRTYLAAVLVCAAGGLLLAPLTYGGPLAHLGFGALALALLFTSGMAYLSILRRRIPSHRAWMTRSYALIFGAVTFRAWLGMLGVTNLPFPVGYAVGSWTSWLINLLVAEILVSRLAAGTASAKPSTASTNSAGRSMGGLWPQSRTVTRRAP